MTDTTAQLPVEVGAAPGSGDTQVATTPVHATAGLTERAFVELYTTAQRKRRRHVSIFVLAAAIIPVLLTFIYVTIFATNRFSVEARFAVRGGDQGGQPMAPTSFLATGGNGALGFVDGYAVRDFLQSRETVEKLDAKVDLTKRLAGRTYAPFRSLPSKPTKDELFDAYTSLVNVRYNMIEQIVVFEVSSFSPQDSVAIAKGMIDLSDEFANNMNRRALDDSLKVFKNEIAIAERRSADARLAITQWRDSNKDVDPAADVALLGNLLTQLETQLLAAQSDLNLILASADPVNHPRRRYTDQKIADLRKQIAVVRQRMAGGEGAVASRLSGYEMLKLASDFADQNLTSTRQSFEQARINLMRQQRYVMVIAEPNAPASPTYPSLWYALGGACLVGVGLAFFGSILAGLVRDAIRV